MDKILIIDDSLLVCKIISDIFKNDNCEVLFVTDPVQGIEKASKEIPNVILLDVTMPSISGFEVFKKLKTFQNLKYTPVIFITSGTDDKTVESCFNCGANDYIKKPFNSVELRARVLMHMENAKVNKRFKEVLLELKQIAHTDPLTNLYNRRYFIENASLIHKNKSKKNSIVICDIDNFKVINDTYGHDNGDYVLKICSDIFLKKSNNTNVIAARWGGEEFIFYFHDCEEDYVFDFCENIRQSIENYEFVYNDGVFKVTASFGIRHFDSKESIEDSIKASDVALYKSKADGKNRITVKNKSK